VAPADDPLPGHAVVPRVDIRVEHVENLHRVIVQKTSRYAVSLMRVAVDVEHDIVGRDLTRLAKDGNADSHVVIDIEPFAACRLRMVKSTAEVDCQTMLTSERERLNRSLRGKPHRPQDDRIEQRYRKPGSAGVSNALAR
jgi:hypothetical protein